MMVFGRRIYRDDTTATGLSSVAGRPIMETSDLPPHLVAIHLFPDAQSAVCFVAGLRSTPRSDRVAVTHETGDVATNRVVALAFLDEPRRESLVPEGAVLTVEHPRSTLDREALKLETARRLAVYAEEAARHDARTAPLRDAMILAGYRVTTNGGPWIGVDLDVCEGDVCSVTVDVPLSGALCVRRVARDLLASTEPHIASIRAAVASAGAVATDDGTIVIDDVRGVDGVIAAFDRIDAARRAGEAALAYAREEAFKANFRVTVQRARLMERVQSGFVGLELSGSDEVTALVRVGWLHGERSGLALTELGRAVLAAHKASTRDRVRSHRLRAILPVEDVRAQHAG